MKRKNLIKGLLLNVEQREAGSFKNDDGETVAYDGGLVVTFLDEADNKIKKWIVAETVAKSVDKQLDDVFWGAYVQIGRSGKFITSVDVLVDTLADDMDEDILAQS